MAAVDSLSARCLAAGSKDAGRFGSLTNLLLRTLFDTKVTVRNVVIKFESPVTVATFTCHSILIATALDDWRSNFEASLLNLPGRCTTCKMLAYNC